MAVLRHLPKVRWGLGLAFGAHFLHDFSIKKMKLHFLRLFDNFISKYLTFKIISCMQRLFWVIYQTYKEVCG